MKLSRTFFAVWILSLVAVPAVFAGSEPSHPEEGIRIGAAEFKDSQGIRVGKGRLKGGFSTQGQFDSNVYLTNRGTTKDYIFTLSPKLLYDLPFGIDERHLFQAMYSSEGGLFCDQTSQNYYNQQAAGNLNLKLPFGFFNVNDKWVDTTDRAGTEFTSRVHRIENTASATLGVERNKLSYEFNYQNYYEGYFKPQYKNLGYYENDFKNTFFYQLFPKTKALVEYTFGMLDYFANSSRSGHFNQVVAGLKGDLTGKTVGIAKAGFQIRDYDNGKGYAGFIGDLGFITTFTERTQLTVMYHTTPVESTASSGNYYTSNMLSAQLDQKLIGHLSAMLKTEVDLDHYPQINAGMNKKRQDWIFRESVWLYYNVKKWGKLGLGYDFARRSSNAGSESYTDNLVSTRFDLFF
jgi:hypothetical protein